VNKLYVIADYTWPIVAQQPPVFYEKAITIPMLRCFVGVELSRPRLDSVDTAELWPTSDADHPGMNRLEMRPTMGVGAKRPISTRSDE
jgi:hypothetical protein